MPTKRNTGRRLQDRKKYKAVWLVYSFLLGYIIAIAGIDFNIFGDVATEINGFVTKCGGVATVALFFTIGKYLFDRKRNEN